MTQHRRSGRARTRVASTQEVDQYLARQTPASTVAKKVAKARLPGVATHLPPQAPRFLKDLPEPGVSYEPRQVITKQLKQLIDKEGYREAFQSAVTTVASQNIPELRRVQTLDQYYYFVDAIVTWLPELRVWEWQGEVLHERTDYLRITQFYYYFNQPELEALQSPIDPVKGTRLTPISRWLRDFAVAWGEFLDTPESAEYLESYKFGPEYNYQDYVGCESGYRTFNDWFSRTFRDIDKQRPVAQPEDDRIVAFPAESTYVGQWAITSPVPAGEPLPSESSIVVKHIEWPIPELLKDSEYGKAFEGGVLVHSFLNVYDYHRQHAPVSGRVLEAKFIPGQVYLDVELQQLDKEQRASSSSDLANAVIPRRYLDAEDPTGYQFVQCRGLMVLQTPIGKVAVLPMGMAQVSSVVFVKPGTDELIRLSEKERQGMTYEQQVEELNKRTAAAWVGQKVKKGEMISSFLFGGSDIVMCFDREANINITASQNVHYPVRSQYAYSNVQRLINDV